jgi:hypothetical protein
MRSLLAALVLLSSFAHAQPPAKSVKTAKPAPQAGANHKLISDWFALGSGCRARPSEPGDVSMTEVKDPAKPHQLTALFKLEPYQLQSSTRAPDASKQFARECAVRMAVNPPPGTKIKRVSARTQLLSTKSEGAQLTLLGELLIGDVQLGRLLVEHAAGTAHTGKEQVIDLAPGTAPGPQMPALTCGQAKLVGFNFTFLTALKSASDTVGVQLGGDRTLALQIELEPCGQ